MNALLLLSRVPRWAYAALGAILLLVGFGIHERHQGAKQTMAKVEKTIARTTELHQAAKAKTEKAQAAVTQKVSTDYEKDLTALRSRFDAYRLRHPGSGAASGSNLPRVPDATGRFDEAPRCDGLPLEAATQLAQAGEENTLQLTKLQDWVNDQYHVTNPSSK